MANHSKALKRLRHTLIREIQDPGALLDSLELRDKFSGYERSQIMSPPLPCERAEKLIDVMEFSTVEVFQAFMSALRRLKPELTMKLERMLREVGGASESSSECVVIKVCMCGGPVWWSCVGDRVLRHFSLCNTVEPNCLW